MAFGSVAAVAAGSSCVAACRSVGRGGGRGPGVGFGASVVVGSGVGFGGRVAGSSLSRLGAPVSVSAGRRVGSRRLAAVSAVVSVRRRCLSCPRGRFRSGPFGPVAVPGSGLDVPAGRAGLRPREDARPEPDKRLAAQACQGRGLPESGNPGLSALLLCFWVTVLNILLLSFLLLFFWRSRLSYLVPLLPRPRRVR